jgi:hypothetical protein
LALAHLRAVGPVGVYGLAGIGAIDDDIRKALGLPIKENI